MLLFDLQNRIYNNFPFDVLKIVGNDSLDFFHRISTNDFKNLNIHQIQKTLFITEKGKLIDAAWIKRRENDFLILCSKNNGENLSSWLNKFIIMEDIIVENVTEQFRIDVTFQQDAENDYFGFPAAFTISEKETPPLENISETEFEKFRIINGIPKYGKEISTEYNPLELNLWSFISFTKGCYIGQEVIARLDTYNKIQKSLCYFISSDTITESGIIVSKENREVGKITSTLKENDTTIGLAVIKQSELKIQSQFGMQNSVSQITIQKIFSK